MLSDIYAKITKWVKNFVEVGDIAVQYDPVHAALPWAAVRLILQSSFNHSERHTIILEGVEAISRVLAWSQIQEQLYLGQMHGALHRFQKILYAYMSWPFPSLQRHTASTERKVEVRRNPPYELLSMTDRKSAYTTVLILVRARGRFHHEVERQVFREDQGHIGPTISH